MSSIDRMARRPAMPVAEFSSAQQELGPLDTAATVLPDSAVRTSPGTPSRPVNPQRAPSRLNNGGLLSALIARRRSSSRDSSTHGDRGSVEADDFQVIVPVVADRRSGNGGQSNSSDSSAQSFVNVPTHAGAAAEFQKSLDGAPIKFGAVLERQIEAAQMRLGAIAATETRQHLIDALDSACIELMERAGLLVKQGEPAAAIMRLLVAGMSRLYERYAPDLPADLSDIVRMLKQRALTLTDKNGASQDVPQSARALYASLPLVLYSARSGHHDMHARLDA